MQANTAAPRYVSRGRKSHVVRDPQVLPQDIGAAREQEALSGDVRARKYCARMIESSRVEIALGSRQRREYPWTMPAGLEEASSCVSDEACKWEEDDSSILSPRARPSGSAVAIVVAVPDKQRDLPDGPPR